MSPRRMLSEYEVRRAIDSGQLDRLIASAMNDGPTEEAPEEAEMEKAVGVLRQNFPHWRWNDGVLTKRLTDLMRDAFAGTQAEDQVPRLRQASPDDEFLDEGGPEKWNKTRKL